MAKPKPAPAGKTLNEFREAHDKGYTIPKRIETALAELGDSWLYEIEFMRLCRVSATDFAAYRDRYAAHFVEVPSTHGSSPKRVWAGTTAFAARLRESIR